MSWTLLGGGHGRVGSHRGCSSGCSPVLCHLLTCLRSGLLYKHRGEQTKPGLWKTIFSSLPRLPRDAEAPVCPSPPPPYHLLGVVPAPIRLGMNGEEETSFLRQLLLWARMLTSQRGTRGARGRVTAKSGPEGTASPTGLAASRRPFQRA